MSSGYVDGKRHTHFQNFLKKELEEETREEGEEPTPPASAETEEGMVVTQARQHQQDTLEEERLRKEQDGLVITMLDSVDSGVQAEGTEDLETKQGQAEAPGENQVEEQGTEGSVTADLTEEVGESSSILTREELGKAQGYNATLANIREKTYKGGGPYFWKEDILMREPYHVSGKELIRVSRVARNKVLRMAHNTPIAGHFNRDRMFHAIRARLDWPGVVKDVEEMCNTCPVYQKAGPAVTARAPLHPLPVMKEPFKRMAMDVVGPLPHTRSVNEFLLIVMDYATKWPEAFALRNVTTETVVHCLVEMTARIGVPKELLSDNGSNFMSKVMKQYCETTGIKQLKISPYHPQTDGMVERFNSTFKRLLRKLTQDPNAEWDKCLPYVLWAYRGTIHKTTGFSPYELLFSRDMKMPLDQMVRYWKGKGKENEIGVTEYIQTLRVNMQMIRDLAYENKVEEKVKQKHYYDLKTKGPNFCCGRFCTGI